MGRPRRTDKRICFNCHSETTYVRKQGWEQWRNRDGNWYCKKCNNKLFDNPITHAKWSPKQLQWTPKGQQIYLKENPRKGICQLCGAIKGIDCKITVIHHIEYDKDNPLKNMVELCVACHKKQHLKT